MAQEQAQETVFLNEQGVRVTNEPLAKLPV